MWNSGEIIHRLAGWEVLLKLCCASPESVRWSISYLLKNWLLKRCMYCKASYRSIGSHSEVHGMPKEICRDSLVGCNTFVMETSINAGVGENLIVSQGLLKTNFSYQNVSELAVSHNWILLVTVRFQSTLHQNIIQLAPVIQGYCKLDICFC